MIKKIKSGKEDPFCPFDDGFNGGKNARTKRRINVEEFWN